MGRESICRVFWALGDDNRLQIIEMLLEGEKCACKILEKFNFSQPTLSHHMKILCESGLVNCRREGKWNHYSISGEKLKEVMEYLGYLTGGK